MSALLERAAIAMFLARDKSRTEQDWHNALPSVREDFGIYARAAIEAIREPDKAMLKAGKDADWVGAVEGREGLSIMPGYTPCRDDHYEEWPKDRCKACSSPGIWPAMLDSLLSPSPKRGSKP